MRAGGRGLGLAVIACVLSFASIVGGKLMAAHWGIDAELRNGQYFDEETHADLALDAELFAEFGADINDGQARRFMVERSYTDKKIKQITDEELQFFLDFNVPLLLSWEENCSTYDQWVDYSIADIRSSISIVDMLYDSEAPEDSAIDVVFLVIGLGAAYRLVTAASQVEEFETETELANGDEA